ncbi:hypothetical protein GE21DRAFT_965 [Neurospora crassa]|uniref:Uncharacterized protein n=1 Tax=Neurospora crassa (strain ATCC 24698 / 74-OR23-1A / CBS 708.71 / DSM 1257 / FGSC 987) TaxID=367110 RepID=Q7SCM4_NEUCR|nr:hypothetical protein NCU02759 [Neurospora crassa OR74A]EAA34493.1 hypothetical protein NCU02759 [Neurospora crassa OR74A]KHE78950.1 hypothetical protein GE21DRAFT_965 [Neurospora crassa]|eukprot:XP_963729.1 hypothetical protein NCU02759 [Neurospora crassa OR74A]
MALPFTTSQDPDSINGRLRRLMSRKRVRSKKEDKRRAVESPVPTTPIVALAKRYDPCSFRTRLADAGIAPELGQFMANHLVATTTTTTPKASNGCVAVERSLGRPDEVPPTPLRATLRVSSRTLRSRKRSRQEDDDGYTPSASTKIITVPSSILIVPSDEDGSDSLAPTPLSPGFDLVDIAFSTVEEFEDTEMVSWNDRRRDSGPINFDANMSTMRMPFSYQHPRGTRRSVVDMVVTTDSAGFASDEWSVIADASMIPTFGPSDVMKQPIHQAIVRSFVSRCRAAKRRMMTSRRHVSCRHSSTDMTAGQRASVGAVH